MKTTSSKKSAWAYKVVFDAGNLSNEIYFGRLKAGKYLDTKKMVLMKWYFKIKLAKETILTKFLRDWYSKDLQK